MATKPTAPQKLSRAGKKFWSDITGKYTLRTDELRILEDACREMDLIDRLERELETEQTIVHGSQGQPVINPLIPEQRQHRATLASLLRQLKLPDAAATPETRSNQARDAANARWASRGASA